jgi:hypothetical protein
VTSLKRDPEVYPRVGKTDQAFRLGDGPAVHMSLNSLVAIASARASCISRPRSTASRSAAIGIAKFPG